jgi:pilus assembly protein CpaF
MVGMNNNNNGGGTAVAQASFQSDASAAVIKIEVHRRLLESMDLAQAKRMGREQLQAECSKRVDQLLNEQRCPLSTPEKQKLLREVMDEIFGLGPLEDLLRDGLVTDILVNGPHQIYLERQGRLFECEQQFRDNEHLIQVIQRIAARGG